MEIKLTKSQVQLVLDSVDYYYGRIMDGEVPGAEQDLDELSEVFIQLFEAAKEQ